MTRCPHCGQTHGPDNHFCGVTGQPLDLGPRLLGQVLLDRFEITTLVGEGPLAVVLGGKDRQAEGRPVAIKMLHPRYARDAAATERFLAEARKVGELGHPGLAPVHAVGRDPGGAPVVVRELLTGVCLARYVRERGPLSEELAAYVVRGILAALQAVHSAGLYNGDLTTDDVFLTAGAGDVLLVKVLDFGEAHLKRALITGGLAGPEATRWWAPEQVRSGIVNDRSDVFAVGAMLYFAVTGKQPYPDGIPAAPAVIPIPPNPSALVPAVNRKIDIVVRRAMSLLPTDRYPTAAAFAEALASFMPPQAPKYSETAGAPAKAAAAVPAALPVGLQTAAAPAPVPAPATPAKPAAAAKRVSPKATLIGAPAFLPPPAAGAAAPAAAPVVMPGPEVDQDGATAATLQMPSLADAQRPVPAPAAVPAAAPGRPKAESKAPAFSMSEPATAPKRGKAVAIVIVLLALVAVVVTVIWFVSSGEEAAQGDAAAKVKPTETAGPAAADAGASAPAEAAPAVQDAGAAEAAAEAAAAETAPDAGPAEAAADAAPAEAAPDVAPEAAPEAAPAEDDAGVVDTAPDETPAVDEAGAPEDAAPEAAPVRDAGAAQDTAAVRDTATVRDTAAPRDAARPRDTAAPRDGGTRPDRAQPRDAGTTQDGRRGVVRDLNI